MTILNKRGAPVRFDSERHIDTQYIQVRAREGSTRYLPGITMKPGDTVALARLRSNPNEAEWVRCER